MASYRGGNHRKPDGYVLHTVTCKKCGKRGLAWAQNASGQWYLVNTFEIYCVSGHQYYKTDFHRCENVTECASGADAESAIVELRQKIAEIENGIDGLPAVWQSAMRDEINKINGEIKRLQPV